MGGEAGVYVESYVITEGEEGGVHNNKDFPYLAKCINFVTVSASAIRG